MSRYDYLRSQAISAEHHPFYALIMAAMRQADTDNAAQLRMMFPETHKELQKRCNAPGGYLPDELEEAAK